jgi:glucans biosynthesis protein
LNIGPVERVSHFEGSGLKAFGLYQRDRSFGNYLDTESHYHERPSARVVLETGFDSGEVLLREIPPDKEFQDNIVAAFIPANPLQAGQAYQFSYTIEWGSFTPPRGLGQVLFTRHGRDIHSPDKEVFLVEFEIPEGTSRRDLSAEVSVSSNAHLEQQSLYVDEAGRRSRVNLQVISQSGGPIELSVTLKSGAKAVSETWLYRWNPYN